MSADRASQPRSIRKVVVASLIGTSLDWYDFFLYGSAAALVFNKLFFPEADPLTGTLLAFATSATGYVAFFSLLDPKSIFLIVLAAVGGLLISMVSVWLAPETARTDLHQEPAWT